VIDHIFNPSLEGKEVGPRTSLGLIKSHGGFISVYSDLGRGTTFQIFLPAKVMAERCAGQQGTNGAK
jgi:signal transduction histidine kinase